MAHELANLLDGSLRNLSLARRRLTQSPEDAASPETDPDALDRLETASEALRQMAGMLRQWMQQAAPADASDSSDPEAEAGTTVGEMVSRVIRLTGPDAERVRVQVRARLSAEAAARPAGEIQSVVLNAVRNSLEAFAEQDRSILPTGQIDIVARTTPSYFELYIHDTGPGLDPRVTDRAERLRVGSTTKQGGHGIGLAHAEDIARKLGGYLILESDLLGGATLTLRHPLKPEAPAHA